MRIVDRRQRRQAVPTDRRREDLLLIGFRPREAKWLRKRLPELSEHDHVGHDHKLLEDRIVARPRLGLAIGVALARIGEVLRQHPLRNPTLPKLVLRFVGFSLLAVPIIWFIISLRALPAEGPGGSLATSLQHHWLISMQAYFAIYLILDGLSVLEMMAGALIHTGSELVRHWRNAGDS